MTKIEFLKKIQSVILIFGILTVCGNSYALIKNAKTYRLEIMNENYLKVKAVEASGWPGSTKCEVLFGGQTIPEGQTGYGKLTMDEDHLCDVQWETTKIDNGQTERVTQTIAFSRKEDRTFCEYCTYTKDGSTIKITQKRFPIND